MQKGMSGNATFFPQSDPSSVLQALPPTRLNDSLSIIFGGSNIDDLKHAQKLRMPVQEYVDEIKYLQQVCAPFKSVTLMSERLSQEDGIPKIIRDCVEHIPDFNNTLYDTGPAQANAADQSDSFDHDEPEDTVEEAVAAVDPSWDGLSGTEWQRVSGVIDAKMKMAYDEAEVLKDTLSTSEAHKQFAVDKVASHVQACLTEARTLQKPEVRCRWEQAVAKGDAMVLSSGGTPLDMFSATFWPSIFYDLYQFADAVPHLERETLMPFQECMAHAFSREELVYGDWESASAPWTPCKDRYESEGEWREFNAFRAPPGPSRWRLSHELLHTASCLLTRMLVVSSVRAHVTRRGYQKNLTAICSMTAKQIAETILEVGKKGGLAQALQCPATPPSVKEAMKSLQVSTSQVPGTPAYRVKSRHIHTNFRRRFGPNAIFATSNMADNRSPIMSLLFEGIDSDVQLNIPAPSLPHLMEMKKRVAADPIGHCRFFHAHQTAFFEIVLGSLKHGVSFGDGVASNGFGGVAGDPLAFVGPQEEQERGSVHVHASVWLLDYDMCMFIMRISKMVKDPKAIQEMINDWLQRTIAKVSSVQFESVCEVPSFPTISEGHRGDETDVPSFLTISEGHRGDETDITPKPTVASNPTSLSSSTSSLADINDHVDQKVCKGPKNIHINTKMCNRIKNGQTGRQTKTNGPASRQEYPPHLCTNDLICIADGFMQNATSFIHQKPKELMLLFT